MKLQQFPANSPKSNEDIPDIMNDTFFENILEQAPDIAQLMKERQTPEEIERSNREDPAAVIPPTREEKISVLEKLKTMDLEKLRLVLDQLNSIELIKLPTDKRKALQRAKAAIMQEIEQKHVAET